MQKGKFIVFEGLDGSGRSTEALLLQEYLEGKGYKVLVTKEPTIDSEAGRKVKKILMEKIETDPTELQKLYIQDRKEHLDNQIIPALEEGKIVIGDRYFFSTYAFGTAHGANMEDLIKLNKDFLYPDLILLFKIDAKLSMERIEKRGESKEFFEREEILKRVSDIFDTFPERFKNFKVISAEKTKEEVFEEIKRIVSDEINIL